MSELHKKPDVEAIISDIQHEVGEAERKESPPTANPARLEDELAAANRSAAVGQHAGGVISGIMRKLTGFLIHDINAFQGSAVRTLNLLTARVRAISGEDSERLMEITQRTEAKQVELEKRIHSLEQQLKDRTTES